MACLATCIQASPTNAHCAACHTTFGSVSGFDRHRRAGECLNPRSLGFVCARNGIWRYPAPDPTQRIIWPQAVDA
jgi:hypothetical protein